MFMAIIRHVRFSMRSALGSCVFAREYSFHICVPSGSFFCICSGDSAPGLPASLPNAGNMASWSTPRRAESCDDEISMVSLGRAKSMEILETGWEASLGSSGKCAAGTEGRR